MRKTNHMISLDVDLFDECKSLNINVSGSCNEHLRNLVAMNKQDIDGINIKIANQNLEKINKNLAKLHSEQQKMQIIIQKHQEMQQKKDEEKLIKEKEQIEKKRKCRYCQIDITTFDISRLQKLKDGSVCCKECFFNNYKKIKEDDLI